MKNYKQLLGIAAIMVAVGFLVHSLKPAYALNGPNISMGSNPIENFGGYGIIFTNTSSHDFIITDISCEGNTYLAVSSSNAWYCRPDSPHRFSSKTKESSF